MRERERYQRQSFSVLDSRVGIAILSEEEMTNSNLSCSTHCVNIVQHTKTARNWRRQTDTITTTCLACQEQLRIRSNISDTEDDDRAKKCNTTAGLGWRTGLLHLLWDSRKKRVSHHMFNKGSLKTKKTKTQNNCSYSVRNCKTISLFTDPKTDISSIKIVFYEESSSFACVYFAMLSV